MEILIIGAGFSGAVVAERLSKKSNVSITIIDERSHIGGNCYTERDQETNIIEHKYGPHIFNTDDVEIWNYINNFSEFVPFINRVKAISNGEVYSLPINLHTINQFFRKTLNPKEAKRFISEKGDDSIVNPKNFEQQALKMLGKELYEAFFYNYTIKQWGCEPSVLSASILKRLPVRFNYNDNYYSNKYQGIPKEGYTPIFDEMLSNPKIKLQLKTKFDANFPVNQYDHIFYTGPVDAFFDYKFGKLGYRTVLFEKHISKGDFQGNAVINYVDSSVPYTRIHEHKHFTPWESHSKTIYFKEYSKETEPNDIPFYPKRLDEDLKKLKLYQIEVEKLKKYTFLGRLATYRYMDMQHIIKESLKISEDFIYTNNL